MKTILALCVLLIILFSLEVFVSNCNSDKSENKKPGEVKPITALRIGIGKLNDEDQKEIFYFLPSDVKSSLWNDRIAEVIQSCKTTDQKELLADMQNHLNPEIFDFDSSHNALRAVFASYLAGWKTNAGKVFAGKDSFVLNDLMTGLGPKNNAGSIMQAAVKPDCDCESTSNLCANGCPRIPISKCHMVQTGWPWYVWYDGLCK